MHPALLLLDEPTSALDPRRINSLRTLLRTFVDRGHTMIIISHSMGFLGGVADEILFMDGGLVVEHGTAEQLLNSPQDNRTKEFLEQAE
jgi:ABC-type polar amino acid transport system ATPase subunit